MIVERITLGAIYNTLTQVEINEGKVYDIVLNYKIGTKTISPPVFKDLAALKSFINTNYPYMYLSEESMLCTWNGFKPVKFWVEKENGIQVHFKELLQQLTGIGIREEEVDEAITWLLQREMIIELEQDYFSLDI